MSLLAALLALATILTGRRPGKRSPFFSGQRHSIAVAFLTMRRARLETLVETYRTPVFQYLYRMLDDAAAAERLAEVVFVEAFRSGEGEDSMEIRLFRIATSLVIARGRGGGCRNVPSGGDLLAAVRNLAPVEKAAVILHRYHGFDYAGIGAVLGCSRKAVALILVQAYKSLHMVVPRISSGHSSAVR